MNPLLLFLALESISAPFGDLNRFPPHGIACQNACFADQCVKNLEKQLLMSESNAGIFIAGVECRSPLIIHSCERVHMMQTLQEARRFHACWNALVFSRSGDNRVEHLSALRSLLGEDNFAAGQMPPVFPWWRAR